MVDCIKCLFKSIKTPTVDIELSIAVVISSTSSNIAIDVECFLYETHIDPRKVFVYHSRMTLIYYSPDAQAWNLAMFGNNRFFAFCISRRGIY